MKSRSKSNYYNLLFLRDFNSTICLFGKDYYRTADRRVGQLYDATLPPGQPRASPGAGHGWGQAEPDQPRLGQARPGRVGQGQISSSKARRGQDRFRIVFDLRSGKAIRTRELVILLELGCLLQLDSQGCAYLLVKARSTYNSAGFDLLPLLCQQARVSHEPEPLPTIRKPLRKNHAASSEHGSRFRTAMRSHFLRRGYRYVQCGRAM